MIRGSKVVSALALSALLVGPMAGCSCSNQQTQSEATQQQEATPANTEQPTQTEAPATQTKDDGRIDIKSAAPNVATYSGDKIIASDATNVQEGMESKQNGFGVQETCVVRQPESWTKVLSIGWGRNYVSYAGVEQPWGKGNYTFEYVNEASVEGVDAAVSQATPEAYFGSMQDVKELDANGQKAYYVRDDAPSVASKFVNQDLESMHSDGARDASNDVKLHAYVQRGDKCALTVAISCEVDDAGQFGKSDEELVSEALSMLSFNEADVAKASSYESDDTITSADGSKSVVVKRAGTELLSYAEHSLMISVDGTGEDAMPKKATYDFSVEADHQALAEMTGDAGSMSEENGYEGVDISGLSDYELGGYPVHARVVSAMLNLGDEYLEQGELRAWVEVDDKVLVVSAETNPGEDTDAAVQRVILDRLEFK